MLDAQLERVTIVDGTPFTLQQIDDAASASEGAPLLAVADLGTHFAPLGTMAWHGEMAAAGM